MASLVLMRAVNVGGRKTFRPAELAKRMSALDLVNIGAAGTFVVRAAVSQSALRTELFRQLPFATELIICRGREVTDLVAAEPFPPEESVKAARRFVSALTGRPRKKLSFPADHPAGRAWQVRILGMQGRFVSSLWRRVSGRLLYPNEVVEKQLAVSATTRSWSTFCRIDKVLRGG